MTFSRKSIMCLKICPRCNQLLQKLHANGLSYSRLGTAWMLRRFSMKAKEKLHENIWQPVIGLEIHAQIKSNSKLFSRAGNRFMAPPNSLVSEFDAALPGTLPALNKHCVESAVLSALALRCKINKRSYFDRKHYFYADLPQGYQITQHRKPIAVDGHVLIPARDDNDAGAYYWKKINIIQIQLEQDSGKSLHDEIGRASLVDLNRAGVGLMEIVTSPDFASAEEVLTFVLDLQLTLRKLGTCEGKIAEGNMRVDANISLHRPGEPFGVRSEVKNVAGLKSLQQAIEYEISRQKCLLAAGEEVVSETREFDAEKGITISMRDKEVLQDYRFIPEPNLPPLVLYDEYTLPKAGNRSFINIDEIRRKLPDELPTDIRVLLMKDYKLDLLEASFLLEYELADYFLEVMRCDQSLPVAAVMNWLKINLLGLMNEKDVKAADCPVSPAQMAELLALLEANEVNSNFAHETFMIVAEGGGSPTQVIDTNGWRMINDVAAITDLVQQALETMDEGRLLKSYVAGKHKRSRNKNAVANVVSAVMRMSGNKAHTSVTQKVVRAILDERSLSK